MAQQLLRDANIKPTAEIIADGLGETNTVYVKFIRELQEYSISLIDWRYYNDGKSWLSKGEYKWTTARGTKKVKPIFWLSIWKEAFRVSFFFSEKIQAKLLSLPISEAAKTTISNTEPNGKIMKFLSIIFDITDESQLHDIYVLAQFRKENI